MIIRILRASEFSPPSSGRGKVDTEDEFRRLDERFIAFPVQSRLRREEQSKLPCLRQRRSGLLIAPSFLRPFLSCPASRNPRAFSEDRTRVRCRAFPCE